MPETSNHAPHPAAAEQFPSFAELWQAHLALRQLLSKGGAELGRILADVRAFIARARATGTILEQENERKTAQGILDYWSTELVSLPGTAADDFAPALLALAGEAQVARQPGETAAAEKKIEEESRELVRTAALGRLYRDSGKQYGYLLLDRHAITDAARFRHLDPDISDLVADSEAALRWRSMVRTMLVGLAGFVLAAIVLSWVIYDQHRRRREAEDRAAASIAAVENVLGVLSRQTHANAIPIAVAAELFKGAENILQSPKASPEVLEAHAKLLIQFSDVYVDAGDSKRGLALAEQSEALANQLVEQDPQNDAWQKLVYESAFRIGDAVVVTDGKRTKDKYDLALKVAEALAHKARGDASRQAQVAFMMNKKGDLDLMEQEWDSALSWYLKSLAIGKALNQPPQNRLARKVMGDAWARLGGLSGEQGHFDKSLKEYQESLTFRSSLVDEFPGDDAYQGNLAATYDFMGNVCKNYYGSSGDPDLLDKALQQYNEALKIREARAKDDPGNASRQSSLQREYVAIGDVLLQKQDVAGALAKYSTARDIRQALVFKDPDNASWKANLASTRDKLATALIKDRQFDAALAEYAVILEIRRDLAAKFPDDRDRQSRLATAYEHKGDGLAARGNAQKSQSDLRDAVDAYQAGATVVEAFLRKDAGSRLEPVRDRLRKKAEALTSTVQ